ncbi:MAG: hypothetical protein K8R90_06250 [Candidatus Cloacimonetes bacterium]|nr:hypothetical protein [Candidatus Cloacimonadota bacterium]
MKHAKEWQELFRTMLAEKLANAETSDSEEDLEELVEQMLSETNVEAYYSRLLGAEERRAISNDAFGYLLQLYALDTIDSIAFEKIMTLCMHLVVFMQQRIDLPMIEQLVNLVLFSAGDAVSIKEIVEIFLKGEMPQTTAVIH